MGDLFLESLLICTSMCTCQDWKDLADLMALCFPELTAEQIAYQVKTWGWSSCLFRFEDRTVAYWMSNNKRGPKTAWLEQIGVAPAWRSKGLGTLVCEDYMQFARFIGFYNVSASVAKTNQRSLAMFNALGFTNHPDKTDNRIRVVKDLSFKSSSTWMPPRGLRLSEKITRRYLYPRHISRIEHIIKKIQYVFFVSIRKIKHL